MKQSPVIWGTLLTMRLPSKVSLQRNYLYKSLCISFIAALNQIFLAFSLQVDDKALIPKDMS